MKRSTKLTIGTAMVSLAVSLTGCAGTAQVTKTPTEAAAPAAITGKVVETMDAAGYTYICVEKDAKKTWVAIPVAKVTVGQDIKLLPGAVMPNFTSKSLNRTFESIVFSGGLADASAAAPAAAPANTPKEAQQAILAGKVVETMDAATYTYLLIEKDGKKAWAAVPSAQVKVGDEVEINRGIDMGSFKSSSLNRSFDSIHFSAGIKTVNGKAPVAAAPAAPAADPAKLPDGHPKLDGDKGKGADAAAAPAPPAEPLKGKVIETMDGGGYTYIQLEKGNDKMWFAVPATKVTVGQELTLAPGSVMHNFTSKSLNRTFKEIVFTNRPQ